MEDLIPSCVDPEASFKENGFFVRDRRYYVFSFKGDKSFENEISNFTMKIVYHLKNGTQNTKRLIHLQRYTGELTSIEVSSSDLRPETFQVFLMSNRCTFYGSAYQFKRIIAHLMDHEDEANFITLLGWDPLHEVFAFADKIFSNGKLWGIDPFGIVRTDEQSFYLPAFSEQNTCNEDYEKERLYLFKPGKLSFRQWARLIYSAFGINGAIGIQFLILCVYRDFIFRQTQFFPFLFLFGDFGTGKTSFTEFFLHVFGEDVIGTPLNNATSVALSRIVGRFKNGISYLKEFTNETDDAIQDFILTVYDGSGRETGVKSNDNKTKVFPVSSGIIFDGNFLPSQKTAILSRMILLVFEGQTFSEDQTQAFATLKQNASSGFGLVLIDILNCREKFVSEFNDAFHSILANIRSTYKNQFTERGAKHIALLLTPSYILGEVLGLPYQFQDLCDSLIDFAENQNKILKQNDAVSIFWQALDWGIAKYEITQGKEFQIKYLSSDSGEIAIKLPKLYSVYLTFCRINKIKDTDQSSLRLLLCSPTNKFFIPCSQKGRSDTWSIKGFGSAYKFRFYDTDDDTININEIEINIKPLKPLKL